MVNNKDRDNQVNNDEYDERGGCGCSITCGCTDTSSSKKKTKDKDKVIIDFFAR